MYVQSFKELTVWQRAVELAKEVYLVTTSLPKEEVFGLQSQMRRASVSIAANIAEGKKRKTRKDFVQFLHMADGSAAELETHIIISEAIYPTIRFETARFLLEETQKMLSSMIKKLSEAPTTSYKLTAKSS